MYILYKYILFKHYKRKKELYKKLNLEKSAIIQLYFGNLLCVPTTLKAKIQNKV